MVRMSMSWVLLGTENWTCVSFVRSELRSNAPYISYLYIWFHLGMSIGPNTWLYQQKQTTIWELMTVVSKFHSTWWHVESQLRREIKHSYYYFWTASIGFGYLMKCQVRIATDNSPRVTNGLDFILVQERCNSGIWSLTCWENETLLYSEDLIHVCSQCCRVYPTRVAN